MIKKKETVMKKIISLLLILALTLGICTTLISCKKRIDKGTEAAKLLLANERLDENLISHKIDVGLNSINPNAAMRKTVSMLSHSYTALSSSSAHVWSEFPVHNDTASQFSAFLLNIENEAKYVGEDIANMKNNVGVVDKWVDVGGEQHLLKVYDTKDALFVKRGDSDLHVYFRYTDENANNVYEMYSFMKYDDGTEGKIRTMYIPGARYEYQYINSNGFEDYVIMENSRGYWVGNRYNYFSDTTNTFVRFFPIIIKGDFCYSATIEMYNDKIDVYGFTVVDLVSGCELITITPAEDTSSATLHAAGIKSGLVSLGADNFEVYDGAYLTSEVKEMITSNGVYRTDGDAVNGGKFEGGMVSFDYLWEIYTGYINIRLDTPAGTLDEAFTSLALLLDSYGLTLYRTVDVIAEQIGHAYALGNDFTSVFEWNGYFLDSLSSFESARDVLINDYSSSLAEYEKVKNNATSTSKQKLSNNAAFAPIESIVSANNSYANGTITIGGTAIQITDTDLFESGVEYVLKVALALCNENGTPISVNTVPLSGTSEKTVYSGGTVSLSVSGTYTVPKNLIAGDYALVVYAATADEEIRVSEMVKLGSFSTYNEKLDSSAMDIIVKSVSDTLHVQYAIKNFITMTVESGGKKYTYAELERLANVEILKKGAPFNGAMLEHADGTAIDRASELGAGAYRIMCYLNTADGLAQSYVYVVVS